MDRRGDRLVEADVQGPSRRCRRLNEVAGAARLCKHDQTASASFSVHNCSRATGWTHGTCLTDGCAAAYSSPIPGHRRAFDMIGKWASSYTLYLTYLKFPPLVHQPSLLLACLFLSSTTTPPLCLFPIPDVLFQTQCLYLIAPRHNSSTLLPSNIYRCFHGLSSDLRLAPVWHRSLCIHF